MCVWGVAFGDFSVFGSGGHLVYRSETILAILVGSHLGNIPTGFELHWPKGSGGGFWGGLWGLNEIGPGVWEELTFGDFSIFGSGSHLVYRSGTILAVLVGSRLGGVPVGLGLTGPGVRGVAFKTNC